MSSIEEQDFIPDDKEEETPRTTSSSMSTADRQMVFHKKTPVKGRKRWRKNSC